MGAIKADGDGAFNVATTNGRATCPCYYRQDDVLPLASGFRWVLRLLQRAEGKVFSSSTERMQ